MTFGRFLIAPRTPINQEYLQGTGNELYDPYSSNGLGRAIDNAAESDRERVGAQNAALAANWGWKRIIKSCLDGLPN